MSDYVKVGQPCSEPADVYELIISDFVSKLEPPVELQSIGSIDPNDCFITSGDAIQKTTQLYKDFEEYLQSARVAVEKIGQEPGVQIAPIWVEFEERCKQALSSVIVMRDALIKVRGDAIFLETEFANGGHLLCIPKNPRPRR